VSTAVAQWQGQEVALKHEGYRITYVRYVNPLETDFTADIIHMRAAGVQTIFMDRSGLGDLRRPDPGHDPTGMEAPGRVLGRSGLCPPVRLDRRRRGGERVWIGQLQALYQGEDGQVIPADHTFLTWVQKAHPGWKPDLYTLYGWSSAQLFVEALKAAGKDPTRGKVLAALHDITSFDASGLLSPADPARKVSPSCYIMVRVIDQKYQRVADPSHGRYRCDAPDWGIDGKASYGPTG